MVSETSGVMALSQARSWPVCSMVYDACRGPILNRNDFPAWRLSRSAAQGSRRNRALSREAVSALGENTGGNGSMGYLTQAGFRLPTGASTSLEFNGFERLRRSAS